MLEQWTEFVEERLDRVFGHNDWYLTWDIGCREQEIPEYATIQVWQSGEVNPDVLLGTITARHKIKAHFAPGEGASVDITPRSFKLVKTKTS